MGKFDVLTRHIPQLERGDYDEAARALHGDYCRVCEDNPGYDIADYRTILEKNGIEWELESMSGADVSGLDDNVIIALLTGSFRAERFNEGVFMNFIENGSVLGWLKRLQEIDESLQHTDSPISIQKTDITKLAADCIVNAANSGLMEGGGVCGAIFREAGAHELQKACDQYGGCKTGSAVITPGFKLKARYIIHAVGPRWNGGTYGEKGLLYSCYQASMKLAMENDCHTIAFPVISSGIFGYPKKEAWQVALKSVRDFQQEHNSYKLDVTFAVLADDAFELGNLILFELK